VLLLDEIATRPSSPLRRSSGLELNEIDDASPAVAEGSQELMRSRNSAAEL
jgi:hypothetical protein